MSVNREKLGYTEGLVSIIINSVLFVLKYWAGIVSGSVALIADAWHTLSDSISSLIVIVGVKLSSRKPDKLHPFGHGRWEQIASIFIAFLLAIISWDFLKESVIRYKSGVSANFGTLAIVVTVISIVVKEGLAQYAYSVARKTQNSSIRADGWHHRTDALSSVVVLAGILLRNYFWWIDSLLGVIISLMLFYAVFDITREAISKLLGETPSDELIAKIRETIRSIKPEGVDSHHFHLHSYGIHRELTFHIRLDKTLDIFTAHTIATGIEKAIFKELEIETTIHIEPADVEHE
jgi:cation diffusion facilitator family transporter